MGKLSKEEKMKAIEKMQIEIIKAHGEGAIRQMSASPLDKVDFLSTGIIGVDSILSGGFARGRMAEVIGMESSAKTTLMLHTVAECQKNGGLVAYIDQEHALDIEYAKALGVDVETLWVSQPESAEQAFDIAEKLIESECYDLVIIDSIGALVSAKELEGDFGDANMAALARLLAQMCRKLCAKIDKTKTAFVLLNQYRSKIGIVFGSPDVPVGGNSVKFFSSQRLDMRKADATGGDADNDATGVHIKVKCIKNKVGNPYRKVELNCVFGKGISKLESLIETAVSLGIIDKKGSWYAYGETKIGQGSANVASFLESNSSIQKEIDTKCRDILFKRLDNEVKKETEAPKRKSKKEADSITFAIPEEESIASLAEQALDNK